ncbi:ABC transporter permease [Phycicoccus endophyticus]|uniref:ABC transporter permease n=1 Tax=Phycicoccus endophyticus TaxID=1690220 RepID=A0A7G9R1B0_9MICO|nr:ABC transporter permease [Phycicoccus endophyticus]NHI18838.1 ABC transporter permease [Phycicoccus endophyticus]QNN49385.1 ABC transporter permease [Phycicoccus endophyticus]GGL36136.1 ABC transporter permease [Phycicoccus endophyticus]
MSSVPSTQREAGWALVARREIVVKITDRAFLIGTLVTLLLIGGLMGYQVWDAGRTATYTVAATSDVRPVADRLASDAPSLDEQVAVEVDAVADDAAARAAVRSGDADAWLHRGDDGWVLTTDSEEKGALTRVTQDVVRDVALEEQAADLGTTVQRLRAGSTVTTALLRGDAEQSQLAGGVAYAFAFLFYVATLTFGITLANSVVEEKQSRVVEIIATSVPVRQLLIGKVVGNSVLAIAQMLLYAGVGLVGLSFTPYASLVPGVGGPVAWFVAFFVAGFVALAALWAVAGALASRVEEVQSTATPLTFLVLAVFLGALLVTGTARTVLSFVPPFSAVLMPTRLLEGDATWWQAVLAFALLLAAAGGVVVAAERLYRRSLLQTGGKLSMRQAWSAPE